jgi:hypothetical protein
MRHLRKFNESESKEKEFMIKYLSGGGTKTLGKSDIERTCDLSEEDDNTEQTLAEFLDEAKIGDTWVSNTLKITCI